MASSESPQVIWLDANVYTPANKDLLQKILLIDSTAKEFVEDDECERFVKRGLMGLQKFILIVSGSLSGKIVPDMLERPGVVSIYIYCQNKEKYQQLYKQYEKVTVVTSPDQVLRGIKAGHEQPA